MTRDPKSAHRTFTAFARFLARVGIDHWAHSVAIGASICFPASWLVLSDGESDSRAADDRKKDTRMNDLHVQTKKDPDDDAIQNWLS